MLYTTSTGTAEISTIAIPDVRNLAEHVRGTGFQGDKDAGDVVMDLWLLAHDLRLALQHAAKLIDGVYGPSTTEFMNSGEAL